MILLQKALPFLIVTLLVLCRFLPYEDGLWAVYRPDIALVGIFYWSINSPKSLSFFSLFLLGLIADTFSGATLGTHACVYILFKNSIGYLGRYNLWISIYMYFTGFSIMTLGSYAMYWLEYFIRSNGAVTHGFYVYSAIFTILFSPIFLSVFSFIYRKIYIRL